MSLNSKVLLALRSGIVRITTGFDAEEALEAAVALVAAGDTPPHQAKHDAEGSGDADGEF